MVVQASHNIWYIYGCAGFSYPEDVEALSSDGAEGSHARRQPLQTHAPDLPGLRRQDPSPNHQPHQDHRAENEPITGHAQPRPRVPEKGPRPDRCVQFLIFFFHQDCLQTL